MPPDVAKRPIEPHVVRQPTVEKELLPLFLRRELRDVAKKLNELIQAVNELRAGDDGR